MSWKTIKYRWRWQLKSSPPALWPYVADTQRFNRASNLPSIIYTELPLATGGSRRIGRTSKFGIQVEFEDHPFDWIKEQGFSNLRVFKTGPLARTLATLRLQPNEKGTLLCYDVEVTPANLLGLLGTPYQFNWEMRRNFGRVFRQIDDYIQNQAERPFTLVTSSPSKTEKIRLNLLTRKLAEQGHELRWVQRLAELIINETDLNLMRLRPYVLADEWQALRRTILEMFLSAAKLGLLNMRWDVMCPLCRGAKLTTPSLDELRKGVHCPTCNIDFEANFTKNVELTFIPHPQIRRVDQSQYCVGGPMVTPHILAHQTLEPGETRAVNTWLETNDYRIRTQRQEVETWFKLEADRIGQLVIEVDAETIQLKPEMADRGASDQIVLVMTNKAPYRQRIYVERAEWYSDAVTAAYVTSLQQFRDLFSDEVLRPGEEIGVQGLTILFSDLVGSTAMYNRRGDAPSYALVRKQFAFLQGVIRRHDGAIVKTIGDAIMATFSDPADGVAAALAIQKEIIDFNAAHPDNPLIIKLGLHHGPCIAVNLNGRLDYFGATVNLAARLEGQSQGSDVVISHQLAQDPAVIKLLELLPVEMTRFETNIKGFEEQFWLYRLRLLGEGAAN